MKKWLRRILGAVGMSLIWAALWAAVGALIGMLVDPNVLQKMWLGPPIGMSPGFLGGAMFSAMLEIAARRRRLGELSLSGVATWGAMAGLLVGVLPFAINEPPTESPLWLLGAVVIGSMTLLGAVSATVSLPLARWAESREILDDTAVISPH